MSRKLLFLIPDGMGDWPVEALGGKTPLMAAHTPHMDELAARGIIGACQTVPAGMPPGSDVANMSLLGFDPAENHTGRGPIEAAAQGLSLDPDDLVWRLNLVTVEGRLGDAFAASGVMRDYAAGHIETRDAAQLVEDLQTNLGDDVFSFQTGVQYRHLLVQRGGALAPEAGLDIRPPHDILDQPIAEDMAAFGESDRLIKLLTTAAGRLSMGHNTSKANAIWPWGQGRPLILPDFQDALGLRGAVISAVDLVRGLGRAANMEILEVEGATGLIDTNYEGKVAAALDFLNRGGEFVYLHVEAPDECGHGGDPEIKAEAIARFDARIIGPIREALGGEAAYMVACDHLTPVSIRTHAPDPVPFLFACPGCPESRAAAFNEQTAAASGVVVENGFELLPWCLERLRPDADA